MLEKTDRAIKNGQSRDEEHRPHKIPGVNPDVSEE